MALSIDSNKEKLEYALTMCDKYNGRLGASKVIEDIMEFIPDGYPDKRSMRYVLNMLKGDKTHLIFHEAENKLWEKLIGFRL